MKLSIILCALLLNVASPARADALNPQHVAADAKWLIHLDCDNLRQTQIGAFLLNQLVAPKAAELGAGLKLDVTNLLQRISSITAYGTEFTTGPEATGVLLINSDADTRKVVQGVLAAQLLANTNSPLKQLESDGDPLYSFASQVFVCMREGGPIIVSRSTAQIDQARELLAGKGTSVASAKTFAEYPIVSNNFFFLAVADGLKLPNTLPAQSKVLQMTDGGRIALGEKKESVFLDVALRTKTVEATRQIQQVVEGMIALVSLGQPENQDIMDLAKAAHVSSADRVIRLNLEYPTAKLITRVSEKASPKTDGEKPPRQKLKKAKQKKHADSDSEPATAKPEAEQPADPAK